jgi:putative addiction module component (TIGR02574 family)
MSAAEILEQIRSLNPLERREVVEQVWCEFGDDLEYSDDLTPARVAELESRAEQLRRHPERGIPLETVHKELKGRLEKGRACRAK